MLSASFAGGAEWGSGSGREAPAQWRGWRREGKDVFVGWFVIVFLVVLFVALDFVVVLFFWCGFGFCCWDGACFSDVYVSILTFWLVMPFTRTDDFFL